MIVIELTAALDDAGTIQTFYASEGRFVTRPTDTPADVAFEPRIQDPGSIRVRVFSDGQTTGASELDTGEVVLANVDGALDHWLDYSFDGRPVVIRMGDPEAPYPSGWATVFTGTVRDLTADRSRLLIRLKDKQHLFEVPVLTTRYAGTNVGPAGIEGTADTLKGRVKPRVYGKVLNISPPLVNGSKLVYQVSDRPVSAIHAVYDRGVSLTFSADYADLTALNAATIASGAYATCLAEGLFRLDAAPDGEITCDVTGQRHQNYLENSAGYGPLTELSWGSFPTSWGNGNSGGVYKEVVGVGRTASGRHYTDVRISGTASGVSSFHVGQYAATSGQVWFSSGGCEVISNPGGAAPTVVNLNVWEISGATLVGRTSVTLTGDGARKTVNRTVTSGDVVRCEVRIELTTATAHDFTLRLYDLQLELEWSGGILANYGPPLTNTQPHSAGRLLRVLGSDAGISAYEISGSDAAALETGNSATVGVWVDDESTFLEAMDTLAQGVGAFYGFNPTGELLMGVWGAPGGVSAAYLEDYLIRQTYERRSARDTAVPAWAVTVNYSRLYTVQTSDLAGSVTVDRRAYLGEEYRSALAEDLSVRTKYRQATSLVIDSALVDEAAAQAEADRLLAIHKVRRDSLELPVPLSLVTEASLALGRVVTVDLDRFGLSGGKLMRIQGIALELRYGRAVLTVWG